MNYSENVKNTNATPKKIEFYLKRRHTDGIVVIIIQVRGTKIIVFFSDDKILLRYYHYCSESSTY